MAEKERITNPSMGSNEVGEETNEEIPTGVSAGSDTQLHLTALGGKKHKKHNKINVDTTGIQENKPSEFPKADETDE